MKASGKNPSKKTADRTLVDAFFSHASQQADIAMKLTAELQQAGLKVWIDDSNVKIGSPLRTNLRQGIVGSHCMVLLWSETALASRWVMMEIVLAYHNDRFIVPVAMDTTPLPQFLQNISFLAWTRDQAQMGPKLVRAIRSAPAAANEVPAFKPGMSDTVREIQQTVAQAQMAEIQAMGRDNERAREIHGIIDKEMKKIEPLFPFESTVLNLAGYHLKNAYMLEHWDAIQAGRMPSDPLLQEAERRFFDSLCVDPSDPSALNGLGTILMFQHEWDEAELLQRRAIHFAGGTYPAAQHDLELVLRYKSEATG